MERSISESLWIVGVKDNVSFFWGILVKNAQVIFDYFSLVGKLRYGVKIWLIVNRFIFRNFYITRKIFLRKTNCYFLL